MIAGRPILSKRYPGESRDRLIRDPSGCSVGPGLRRDDHSFSVRRSSEICRAEKRGVLCRLAARLRVAESASLSRPALSFLLLAFIALAPAPAHAVRPDEMLADPALEARARDIGRELRCLVCRNQSIDDSDADLAHDLRVLVRERLGAGDTNPQVIAYIRSRYGDFVLLRPPLALGTMLLWAGPALILVLGAFGVTRFYRVRAHDPGPGAEAGAAALSPEEQRRLRAVLGEEP
jgi:cytochrome c-type biogenesis protein CcmH